MRYRQRAVRAAASALGAAGGLGCEQLPSLLVGRFSCAETLVASSSWPSLTLSLFGESSAQRSPPLPGCWPALPAPAPTTPGPFALHGSPPRVTLTPPGRTFNVAVALAAPPVPSSATSSVAPPSVQAPQHAVPPPSVAPPSPSVVPPPLSVLGLHRALSTYVGHGSGGRVAGPHLHEPPETHPFAVKGLNHIALAVPSLARAAEHYRTVFGAQVSDPHPLPAHGVSVVFVHVGATTIELLEPLGDHSPIAKFLEKHPRGGVHHLCFTVDNIEVATEHAAEEGIRVLGDYVQQAAGGGDGPGLSVVKPQVGAHGNPVVFLDPRDNLGVLCELEQVFCHER